MIDDVVIVTFRLTRAAKRALFIAASRRRTTVTSLIVSGLPRAVQRANRKRRQRPKNST